MHWELLQLSSIPVALLQFFCFSLACLTGRNDQRDLLERFRVSKNPRLVSVELLVQAQLSQTISAIRMRYQALMGPAGWMVDPGSSLSCGMPLLLISMR